MKKINILAVDDDQDMLNFYLEFLKTAGYEVVTAHNGEEALKLLESIKPELIIADVMMPGINGYELCQRIRSMGHDDVPFIFCSALSSLPERIKGLRLGADDYIVKPINGEELVLKTEKMINKNRKFFAMKNSAQELAADGIMHGVLTDVGVTEILQIISAFQPTEINVSLFSPDFISGNIYISHKKIIHAEIGDIIGKKALLRLFSWKEGTFKIERKAWLLEPSLNEDIEFCLLDGLSQIDEFIHLTGNMNLKDHQLEVNYGPDLFMRRFDDKTATVLFHIQKHRNFDKILNLCPYSDLEIVHIINQLLVTKIIRLI